MGKAERSATLSQDLEENVRLTPPASLEPFLNEMGMTLADFLSCTKDWHTVSRFRSRKKHLIRSIYHKLTKQ